MLLILLNEKLVISPLLMLLVLTSQSQISVLRYNDSFAVFKKDTIKHGLDKLKYIKVADSAYISFGGELREQFQYFGNPNFGDVPPGTEKINVGQLWHRLMIHSNVELGPKTRVFVQLSSTFRFFNPNPLTPEIDENQLSLHQAFVDYRFYKNWMLRAGRQELSYGNSRLLGFREGPNTRLTFDAAIIKYSSAKTKIDLIAATPVTSRRKVFDDKSYEDVLLGVYGTSEFVPKKFSLDYYFINFRTDRRRYNYVAGDENRQIFGLRFFSKNPILNQELEATWQTGTFNDSKIYAYAISGDVSYLLSQKGNLTTGLAANYITGDKNRNDDKLNSYNFLFSKPQYGLSAPIGSSNIVNINPYVKVSPVKKLSVFTTVYLMRRQSNQDGTYSPGAEQLRPNPHNLFSSVNKKIGTQYAFESTYVLNKNISFFIDGAFFTAGDYIKETGNGKDITYIAFKASYKF